MLSYLSEQNLRSYNIKLRNYTIASMTDRLTKATKATLIAAIALSHGGPSSFIRGTDAAALKQS